jgi:hypothetical protein
MKYRLDTFLNSKEFIIYPANRAKFTLDELMQISNWCKITPEGYYVLNDYYIMFTNRNDAALFLLTWNDNI